MESDQVINKIKDIASRTLPPGSSLWLYGSRARGDAHDGSDWDLLIILDKDKLTLEDYRIVLPLNYLSWDIGETISPQVYAKAEWDNYYYTPFYKNVEREKCVLI
ncbi:MAG: nucleotidyltransferase domain-containing protein [Bacteroidales bacterium]|nr:nucleotidyltransferase domain-containing protein [Bacteroidales bacterium]